MDESAKMHEPRTSSAANRHRLDSGSATNRREFAARDSASADQRAANRSTEPSRHWGDAKPPHEGPRAGNGVGVGTSNPRVEYLGFDEALQILRRGGRVARRGWNGAGQYLALVVGASVYGRGLDAAPVGAHIVIQPANGDLVPWTANQTDLLALDWCLVREEKVLVYGNGTNAPALKFEGEEGG